MYGFNDIYNEDVSASGRAPHSRQPNEMRRRRRRRRRVGETRKQHTQPRKHLKWHAFIIKYVLVYVACTSDCRTVRGGAVSGALWWLSFVSVILYAVAM